MKITLTPINHDDEDNFEEFIKEQLEVGTRVVVEWNGLFTYATVGAVE